jgi:proteasome lid subunit RPN8/RPN11
LASDPEVRAIEVPILLWRRLVLDLRRQGGGRRESGAFLLGRPKRGVGCVTRFVCYDQLDPDAYQSGAITFHDVGYAALWRRCRETGLEVLADVHTHPGEHVGQSGTDRENPMVPNIGHTAMIVPNFARTRWWSLTAVGVYEYLGSFRWRTHDAIGRSRRVALTIW